MNKAKKESLVFLAFDGDNIGNEIERLILINDITSLEKFSINYERILGKFIKKVLVLPNSSLIFQGGDNFMVCLPIFDTLRNMLDSYTREFCFESGTTISVGVGTSPREAFYALKFAKACGKNSIKYFEELG